MQAGLVKYEVIMVMLPEPYRNCTKTTKAFKQSHEGCNDG